MSGWLACGICAWHGWNLGYGYTTSAFGQLPTGPHIIPNVSSGQEFDGARWWNWCRYGNPDEAPVMVWRFYHYQDDACQTFLQYADVNVFLSMLLSWTGTPPNVEWWARVRMWSQVNGIGLMYPYESALRFFQTDLVDVSSVWSGTGQAIGHPSAGFALTNVLDWCYCDDLNYPDFSVAVKNGTLTVTPA